MRLQTNDNNKLFNKAYRVHITTTTTILQPPGLCLGLPTRAGTRKVKPGRRNQSGFTGARDSEWQWHQLGHMQICTSPQTDNHARIPPLSFFTGLMPFLLPNRVKALKAQNCVHITPHKIICKKQVIKTCLLSCLQCFDAVGWVAGRASGLYKLSGEVLAWFCLG